MARVKKRPHSIQRTEIKVPAMQDRQPGILSLPHHGACVLALVCLTAAPSGSGAGW